MNIVFAVGFRQTHHVHPGAHDRFEVGEAKRGVERINTHHGFNILIHRMLQSMKDQQARGIFLAQGHRVFQVEHD